MWFSTTYQSGRRKGKATILTDTPEKNEILKRTTEKNQNINRKLFPTESIKRKDKKKVTKQNKRKKTSINEEEDTYCMICTQLYSNSRSREAWIQCRRCKYWSHEACAKTKFTAYYTCDNCEADDE